MRQYRFVLLVVLALACRECWMEIVVVGSLLPFPPMALERHAVFFCVGGIVMLAVALFAPRRRGWMQSRRLYLALGGIMLLSTLCAIGAVAFEGAALSLGVAAAVLGGVSVPLLLLVALDLLCRLDPVVAVLAYLGQYLVAFSFILLSYTLPAEALFLLACVLATFMGVCLYAAPSYAPAPRELPRFDVSPSAWKVIVLLTLLGFTFTINESGMGNGLFFSGSNSAAGSALVYLGFFLGVSLKGGGFRYAEVTRAVLPVAAVLFLFMPQMGHVAKIVSDVSGAAFYSLVGLYVTFTLLVLCGRYRFSALRLFGLAQGAHYLATMLGNLVSQGLDFIAVTEEVRSGILLAVAIVAFVYMIYLVIDGDAFSLWSKGLSSEGASAAPSLAEACAALALRAGLTAREEEVCLLIAEGRTMADIQEDLCLAAGTVKTHRRNIYKKCDVHSRGDLVKLLEG